MTSCQQCWEDKTTYLANDRLVECAVKRKVGYQLEHAPNTGQINIKQHRALFTGHIVNLQDHNATWAYRDNDDDDESKAESNAHGYTTRFWEM